jgi:parallel beta-helix repeat protein
MIARFALALLVAACVLTGSGIAAPRDASANHPVFVEGNCDTPMPGVTEVSPGTCGDWDGDGRIGTAEDTDEADRTFGTLTAALGAGMFGTTATGANQNGRVIIVTSGHFPELVMITAANGNVILEAAPGVDANIDAVVQGIDGNAGRQAQPGIIVNAPANRHVVIRNIVSRNWTTGIQVMGGSRVAIDQCRLDSNTAFGIQVTDTARVTITNCQVNSSGRRTAPMVDNTPSPGIGISFEGSSAGAVAFTTVSASIAAGISNRTGNSGAVVVSNSVVFDNNPNCVDVAGC